MTVTIREDYLPVGRNRPGTPLHAKGVVVHSTATPGATAADEDRYFHGDDRGASAHIFVDWNEAIKLIPLEEIAWHAGLTANDWFIGIELSETQDPAQFARSIENLLDVLVEIFRAYGWAACPERLWSHARTSALWHETDHTDPLGYFAGHLYSMPQLEIDLARRLEVMT